LSLPSLCLEYDGNFKTHCRAAHSSLGNAVIPHARDVKTAAPAASKGISMNDVRQEFDPETGEVTEPAVLPMPKPRKRAAKKKPNGRAAQIPENETPRQRFLRSSATRMKQALTAIDLIAGFGRNRANYEYDEGDAERIAARLAAAVNRMERELARPPSRKDEREAERSFNW
jgi:hypothetical protein